MPKSRLTRGLREQIAIELRNDIVAGRFPPGMQMVERSLAQRFNVSHAPIREALLQLAHEGWLVSQTNRGAQVAPVLDSALRRFFMDLRIQLEAQALQLAFDRLGESEFAAWDDSAQRFQQALAFQNRGTMAELDFNFHQEIVVRAEQHDLLSTWRTVMARARLYADEWPSDGQSDSAPHDHARLVAQCRLGGCDEAVRLLVDNLRTEMQAIDRVSVVDGHAAVPV